MTRKHRSTMKGLCKEFCKHSTVHGLQLVVSERNSLKETVFWSCLMASALVLVIGVVSYYSHMLRHSGVELIVNNPDLDLGNVDFPAVTLCHNSKILRSVVEQTIIPQMNLSDSDLEIFYNSLNALDLMKYPFYHHPQTYIKDFNHSVYLIPKTQIQMIMKKTKPKLEDMINHCMWKGVLGDCNKFFREQVTEEGFCYSFNSKTAKRGINDPEDLPPMADKDGAVHSLRNNDIGRGSGLSFHLKSLDNELLERNIITRGYSVMIHDPESFPDVSRKWLVFWKNYSYARITVKVSTVEVDSSLNQLNEETRGCELTNRISLNACYLECRMKQMITDCGCLPYYMYYNNYSWSKSTCGFEEMECLSLNNIKQRNPTSPSDDFDFPTWSTPLTMNCICPQPCSYTTYNPDISFITREEFKEFHGVFGSNVLGLVEVTYKQRHVTSYLKKAQFTLNDFIVAVGGLVSLLLGCSLFTLVELTIFLYKFLQEAYFTFFIKRRVIYPFIK